MRILSIDDSKTVQSFLRSIFSDAGAEFVDAPDGAAGLHMLKTDKNFDLILLDWEMPIMTGVEVLKHLKDEDNKIPVIMLTSKNVPQDIQMALDLGASEYVMKPFVSEILIEKIESTLNRKVK